MIAGAITSELIPALCAADHIKYPLVRGVTERIVVWVQRTIISIGHKEFAVFCHCNFGCMHRDMLADAYAAPDGGGVAPEWNGGIRG
jgi:hypothetical protein